jgi:hypothetical protein
MCIAEHQIDRIDGQEFTGCSHIGDEMTSESPPVQPFGQSLSALEILSDQQNVPSGECQLAPPKHCAVVSGRTQYKECPKLLCSKWNSQMRLIPERLASGKQVLSECGFSLALMSAAQILSCAINRVRQQR